MSQQGALSQAAAAAASCDLFLLERRSCVCITHALVYHKTIQAVLLDLPAWQDSRRCSQISVTAAAVTLPGANTSILEGPKFLSPKNASWFDT
jgi:hypothetical protein